MKKITSRQIAMTFIGIYLGAGFVSGQEMLQFFGVFGGWGIIGILFAVLIFFAFGCMIMHIAYTKKITNFEKIIVPTYHPILRSLAGAVTLFFLFSVVMVMIAGAGALIQQLWNIPAIVGNIALGLLLALAATTGAKGMLSAFGIVVPFMVCLGLVVSILSFFRLETGVLISVPVSGTNPLIGNWFIAALTFVSYNLLVAISVLTPISPYTEGKQVITRGILLGSVILFLIALCILVPITLHLPLIKDSSLPMLSLAEAVHPILGVVYAVLLLCGMFGSGLSCLFAVCSRVKKLGPIHGKGVLFTVIIAAILGSIAGFKQLIAYLFPLFGYAGMLVLAGVALHYFSLKRKKHALSKS